MTWIVHAGDCVSVMASMPSASIDAVCTDPPYHLGFMGKAWDTVTPGQSQHEHERWAREALRVLKPGGHLLAFGGTRTYHRLAAGIEDAGSEVRDTIAWMYSTGFPKSHNLQGDWDGWGTALKPAHEPIVVARKPLIGTVAANVHEHGVGALNIDGCRIGTSKDGVAYGSRTALEDRSGMDPNTGRWPPNVVLDEHAAALLDQQTGDRPSTGTPNHQAKPGLTQNGGYGDWAGAGIQGPIYSDSGGASRFFYTAKASSSERDAGLDEVEAAFAPTMGNGIGIKPHDPETATPKRNVHPTVKPIELMRWLTRLVTPPGGTVLDPFTGSGTTGCAAALEGFNFVGIEREQEYIDIARARIAWWASQPPHITIDQALQADSERRKTAGTGQVDLFELLAEEDAA